MKYISYLILLSLGFAGCKKDLDACKDYKEISGREQLLDVNGIDFKPFRDTLDKYPQLQPSRYTNDQFSKNILCNVFYKDLLIFSETYSLYKNNSGDSIQKYGSVLNKPLTISLDPSVSHTDAIKNAKRYANFDHTCISYRLGIYNTNPGVAGTFHYRLAWKIVSSDAPYIYVISDAMSNQVFEVNNGRYWVN